MTEPLFRKLETCASLESVLRKMFLDYFNNYLTVEAFAADHSLSITDAETLLNMGRKYHEAYVKMLNAKTLNVKMLNGEMLNF